MAEGRRPVDENDLQKLETDSHDNLYWCGKRVRLAGFSIHEAASWATVALVVVIALANWSAITETIATIF